jgi:hypothetical protein
LGVKEELGRETGTGEGAEEGVLKLFFHDSSTKLVTGLAKLEIGTTTALFHELDTLLTV